MLNTISNEVSSTRDYTKMSPTPTGLLQRITIFGALLICALAIFVLGSNYYPAFPTNGNAVYAASLSVLFLIGANLLKRSDRFARYWQISYAFFVASSVNLVSVLFAGYNSTILQYFGISMASNQGLAFAKVYDALLVSIPILLLVRISGENLSSLFLNTGRVKWWLAIGSLVLINFFTSALIFFSSEYKSMANLGSAVVWGGLFAASNGFLEELWMRGLFLKKLIPLIGVVGTILLTSIWFSALHLLSVAYLPMTVIPIFLLNTFSLGLACSYLIIKTNSIWGAVALHAAADLFLFIALLAIR